MSNIDGGKMLKVLDWAYDKAINGVLGTDSALELANSYLKESGTLEEKINSLIRWQNTKSATSGFVTGLGGLVTLPIAIPANISSVLFVQIRMIAAIAAMCGQDLRDDRVKTLVYACLAGSAAVDLLKDVGINLGSKMFTKTLLQNISRETITAINKAVGFRLVTKFGEKGVINLSKFVPILGGVIGGSIDAISTNTIGNTARNLFMDKS